MTGTRGQGQKDYLTYIDTNAEFKASPIKINSAGDIIIGKNPENISPEYTRFNLYGQTGRTLLQVKTSQNMTAMTVSENGNVSIKTDDSRYTLDVSGNMYVKYIYINGRLLACTYSIGSRWLANRNKENWIQLKYCCLYLVFEYIGFVW